MPLVYHDPYLIGSNGMSQGTHAYWLPSYTNVKNERIGSEILLLSTIASREGDVSDVNKYFGI